MNALAVPLALGRTTPPPSERLAAITGPLPPADADALADIARTLRPLFAAGDDLDEATEALNALLVRHAAVPSVHRHPDRPHTLAFHRQGARLVDAWAADMGTALAMVIGVGQAARLGACQASGCGLVFFDTTRNASRRFCGLPCQNRTKATAYRARRAASTKQ
ncbi:CGNR zinc finger domain-containing protein [Nonomuraea sp. NPDC046570]|uniref:CGNR zinc finger domain-containing protein n=1 Tax=Nonomuraea sp. NPDC046570 TaxID=3155255 RepID=UPI0033ED02AA